MSKRYDITKVEGHLFNPGGKWKYEVRLDYTDLAVPHPEVPNMWNLRGPGGGYLDAHDAAKYALRRATEKGTSGVTISELGDYWTLVVADPPNGFPIMVRGDS